MSRPALIFCRGRAGRLAGLATSLGYLYGARSDYVSKSTPRCVGLVDVNWKKYDWSKHKAVVKDHNPLLAAVPDVLSPKDVPRALAQADELIPYCMNCLIIPKASGVIRLIPSDYIIGVSVPSSYAGYLPWRSELMGRRVHLLGGTPHKQLSLIATYRRWQIPVFSADGNGVCKAALYRKRWSCAKIGWIIDNRLSYYELVQQSLRDWRDIWVRLWS